MSLRAFHFLFVLIAMLGADLFGVWAIWRYMSEGDGLILSLGLVSIVGGLGLLGYAVRLMRSWDKAGIR